jgi:hypothetical protein
MKRIMIISCLLLSLLGTGLDALAADLLTTAENVFYQPDETRVGIEVEFLGLDVLQAVKVVAESLHGKVVHHEYMKETTLNAILPDGTRIYKKIKVTDYIIKNAILGDVILKIETNMVDEFKEMSAADSVIELVTPPLRAPQIGALQAVLNQLQAAGATGTSAKHAVSIQMNTEIAHGKLDEVNWQEIVNLVRVYIQHEKQIDSHLQVPAVRRPYLYQFSDGFIQKIMNENYVASARGLYDDLIYRQSLEILGFKKAWTLPITQARQLLMAQPDPMVVRVVKQTRLRLSSLLMWAFPEDPMTEFYVASDWAKPLPLIEWREFNNDFNVQSPFKQSVGLIQASKKYGHYDHDRLISDGALSCRGLF